jgi:hypothetical protein
MWTDSELHCIIKKVSSMHGVIRGRTGLDWGPGTGHGLWLSI